MAHVNGPRPGAPSRRRRRPFRAVALTLLLLPALELVALVLLARGTSGWVAFGTVVATSLLGAVVLSRQAPRTWRAVRDALDVERLSQGRLPGVELLDGALILAGGVLLLVPGIVSDVVGLLCLLPFVRPPLRHLLLAWVRRRAAVVGVRVRPPGPRDSNVVQGEVLSPHIGDRDTDRDSDRDSDRDTTTPRGSGAEAGRPVIQGEVVDGGDGRDRRDGRKGPP